MKLYQRFITWSLLLLALFVGACAPGSTEHAHSGSMMDVVPESSVSEQVAQPSRTIKISTNDQMSFVPATLAVLAGETIRFEVTNTGVLPHEFIIGTAQVQEEHERMMASGDHHESMHHSDTSAYALSIPPHQTTTLTYTFDQAGDLFYGCHVPGHYAAGMQGTIKVTAAN